MEYAQSKFKQLAVEYALKIGAVSSASLLVEQAKIIEAYLKEENDSK